MHAHVYIYLLALEPVPMITPIAVEGSLYAYAIKVPTVSFTIYDIISNSVRLGIKVQKKGNLDPAHRTRPATGKILNKREKSGGRGETYSGNVDRNVLLTEGILKHNCDILVYSTGAGETLCPLLEHTAVDFGLPDWE